MNMGRVIDIYEYIHVSRLFFVRFFPLENLMVILGFSRKDR
jgi:hypothetical protein